MDPSNDLGRKYWHEWDPETAAPDDTPPTVQAGVPVWAYLQAVDADCFKRIADFYIDKRQAWDGEFGGGLGDDSDFSNLFPSLDLVLFNGTPETRKIVLETVDGMLAHRKQEADGR